MRVAVVGATGNIGSSAVQALAADPAVTSVLGLARRRPEWTADKTEWAQADITRSDLAPLLRGADAVVHLGWIFQPTHDPMATWQVNVLGTARLLRAVAEAGVPALVVNSSVGAYSPGPKDRRVSEAWPTHSWPACAYGREKAYVERLLDSFSVDHPHCRVVRLRPGFVFKRESATEQRRLFGGPFVPASLVRPGLIPVVPDFPGLRFQALHSSDAAEAIRLAATGDARGPFNLAADPVIDAAALAHLLHARIAKVPTRLVRAAVATGWHLRLIPADPNLFDLFTRIPIMDTSRARTELGWSATRTATDAIAEFLAGLAAGAGMETPPLAAQATGRSRLREIATGIGQRP